MYLSLFFARVFSSGPYVQDIGFDIEDAYLASLLRSTRIPSNVFEAGAAGRMTDVMDRLNGTLASHFFFHIHQYNLDLSRYLASSLEKKYGCNVRLWSYDTSLATSDPSIIFSKTLAGIATSIKNTIEGTKIDFVSASSPYRDPVLGPKLKIYNKFLLINVEQLTDDLAWHAKRNPATYTNHVVIDAVHTASDQIEEAVRVILAFALKTNEKYELRITAEAYTKYGLSRVPSTALSFELHGTCHSLALPTNARYAAQADFTAIASAYPRNGTLVYFSGTYPDTGAAPAVTHLHIAEDATQEMELAASAWAAENMTLRSVRIYSSQPRAKTRQVWPLHRYVFEKIAPGRTIVSSDAWNPNTFSLQIRSELDTSVSVPDDVTFSTTSTALEVEQLFEKLEQFERTGTLLFDDKPTYTVNSCRWASVGRCSQDRLRRIQIDTDGAIRSCIDSPPIGHITMPFTEIRRNVNLLATDKSIQRGCSYCPVRSDCSSCNAMPEFLENKYCNLRKSHPSLSLYMELRLLPLILPILAAPPHTLPWHISAPGLPNAFFPNHYNSKWRRPSVIILSRGATTLLWERGTKSISKITNALGFILESYWCDIEIATSAHIAASTFGITEANARKHIEDGLNMLKKGNLC